MSDPVTLLDGHTYEREAIEKWFNAGHATSPLTNRPLGTKLIKPNYALRSAIEDYLNRRPGLIDQNQQKKDWEIAVQLYLKEAEQRNSKLARMEVESSSSSSGLGVGTVAASPRSPVSTHHHQHQPQQQIGPFDVGSWLQSLGYGEYWKTFQETGFDTKETLLAITLDDLKEMKVKLGHARRILGEKEKIGTMTTVDPSSSVITPTTTPIKVSSEDTVVLRESHYQDGVHYFYGSGGKSKDLDQALTLFRQAAQAGHAEATCFIGYMYGQGVGVSKDYKEAKLWYETAIQKGSCAAARNLAVLYENGYGVNKNIGEALRLYRVAASKGDKDAAEAITRLGSPDYDAFKLAQQYFYGKGGKKKDFEEASKLFRQAATQGHAEATCFVGYMYGQGVGVDKDYKEAKRWYEEAIKLGSGTAMRNLAVLYENGYGTNKNLREALKLYRAAAAKGDKESLAAVNRLAPSCSDEELFKQAENHFYGKGGVTKDLKEGLALFKKAAAMGHAEATCFIGYIYGKGCGVDQDYREARKWYEEAIQLGSGTAMRNLAVLCENGLGTSKDIQEALKLYHMASEKGDKDAAAAIIRLTNPETKEDQFKLGEYYFFGTSGLEKDYSKALALFHKASLLGHAEASCFIGYIYGEGFGVTQDYKEAKRWYEQAISLGSGTGMRNLAVLYENGYGVAKDSLEALKWYRQAASKGDKEAYAAVTRLTSAD